MPTPDDLNEAMVQEYKQQLGLDEIQDKYQAGDMDVQAYRRKYKRAMTHDDTLHNLFRALTNGEIDEEEYNERVKRVVRDRLEPPGPPLWIEMGLLLAVSIVIMVIIIALVTSM